MKTATRKAPRRAPRTPKKTAPSVLEQLQAHISAHDYEQFQMERISEAVTLIKYASPKVRDLPTLTLALRMLVEGTIELARENQFFEEVLTVTCDLLNRHIHHFGLIPDGGIWFVYDLGTKDPELLKLFAMRPNTKPAAARVS